MGQFQTYFNICEKIGNIKDWKDLLGWTNTYVEVHTQFDIFEFVTFFVRNLHEIRRVQITISRIL